MGNVKEEDLISVIVPVYNVEKHIGYCLDSIVKQTYKNIEIILVDDASTDNSGALCEEYAGKDSRIKCIHHKKNSGPSAARNHGVEKANGGYVIFIDGDDEIEYNMIEVLHETIRKYDVSVVRCGAGRVRKLGRLKENGLNKESINYEVLEGWKYLLKYDKCSPCVGIYEAGLTKKMKFPVGLFYEDFCLIPRILCGVEKIVYVGNAKFYHYYKRDGSTTETAYVKGLNPDFTLIMVKNLNFFKKKYGKNSFLFLIMEEFIFARFVNDYMHIKKYDKGFLKNYRKSINQNIGSILMNEYIGWKLRIALIYIYLFPQSSRIILNNEVIKSQQKEILKKKVGI